MEHASHISEHLSQSLRSLVRKERAISWPKRALHRFKWFCLARRPYSNVTIRSSPSRDSFCRKQAERKDFDLRQKWWQLWQSSQTRCSSTCSDTLLQSRWRGRCKCAGSLSSPKCAVFTFSFFLWRRWKEVVFSSPKLWLKFHMKILTEKPGRPGHYQVWALNDAKEDKVRFARLLAYHLNI